MVNSFNNKFAINPTSNICQSSRKKIVKEIIVELSNEVGEDQHLDQLSDSPNDLNFKQPSIDFEDSNTDHQPNGAGKSVLTPGTLDHVDQSQGNQDDHPTQGNHKNLVEALKIIMSS